MGVDAALTVLIFHAAFAWGSFAAWLVSSFLSTTPQVLVVVQCDAFRISRVARQTTAKVKRPKMNWILIRRRVGAWLAISASRVVRTICRLFVINKANAAACGHKSARLHAGVMTGALSTIRNAAAVSSMRQFQLGTLQEWFAAARHCAALTCQR